MYSYHAAPWSPLSLYDMVKKTNSTPSFIESDGLFITKPFDVDNDFNPCVVFGSVGPMFNVY